MTAAASTADRESASPASDPRLAMLFMTAFAVLWAVLENVLGVRLQRQYDIVQVVWCRYASHLLIVLAIWGLRKNARPWRTSRPALQIGRSLLMLIMPLSFREAILHGGSPGSVWGLFWLAPLMILTLAHLILHERISAAVWIGTAAATAGAIALVGEVPALNPAPIVWSLVMAGVFALYVVLTRVLRHEPLASNLFFTAFGVFVPLSVVVSHFWLMPTLHDLVILFLIGAIGLVGLLALDRAAERLDVSRSAVFLTSQVTTVACLSLLRAPAYPGTRWLIAMMLIGLPMLVAFVRPASRTAALNA